jgi:hypothetical protein
MIRQFFILFVVIFSAFLNPGFKVQSDSVQQAGLITVSAHYEYYDLTLTTRPTVWGRVWIYDEDPGGVYQRLANVNGINEWFTNLNGNFSSGDIRNQDPEDGGGLDIVVVTWAWNWATVVINNATWNPYGFAVGPANNVPDGVNADFFVSGVPDGQFGAWVIFSYQYGITAGWNYLDSSVNYEMPVATVVWPFPTDSPFYDSADETIFLPDWALETDITLHEYAHYVMNMTYGYMPPAATQYSWTETSDNNTAWVEGWAFFFPLAVQNDPVFIDTNLETQHWYTPDWDDGDKVLARVAGALWDIFDSQNDNAPWYYDSLSDGFQHIWNIMRTTPCNTFHEFWQAWNTSSYPKQPALMAMFQNTVDYRGPGDINADGYVNAGDSAILGAAFNSRKGDSNWDQRADLNYDDYVNAKDAIILGKYFGKHYDC